MLIPSTRQADEQLSRRAEAKGVPVGVLGVVELSGWNHPDARSVLPACNTDILCPFDVADGSPAATGATSPERWTRGDHDSVDVIFTGDHDPHRAAALEAIVAAGMSLRVYGDGWNRASSLRASVRGPIPYPDLSIVFSRARVAVSLPRADHAGPAATGAITSALEAAACRRAVVTVDKSVGDVLARDVECVVAEPDELVDSVRRLLIDPTRREEIASAGFERVVMDHSWEKRWEALLQRPSHRPDVTVTKEGAKTTVVVGIYNVEEYVETAVDSVFAQTMDDWHLLLVNDGTTDDARRRVERYLSDSRVTIHEQENIGQTGRFDFIWRSAERFARSDLISYIGGDDIATPNRLALQLQAFENDPLLDIVHGGGMLIDDAGEMFSPMVMQWSYDSMNMVRRFIGGNLIAVPTVMMRRSLQDRIGEWAMGFAADYHFWLKCAGICRFRYLPESLVHYRVHDKSASTSPSGLVEAIDEGLRLREAECNRHTIADIYPALTWAEKTTDRDWAAAHVDLGNAFLVGRTTGDIAIEHFETAAGLLGEDHPGLHANIGFALQRMERSTEARAEFQKAGRYAAAAMSENPVLFNGRELSDLPFDVPAERRADVWWWDGSTHALRRLLLVVDWDDSLPAAAVVDTYIRAFRGIHDVELVLLTLGLSEDEALTRIFPLIPAGVDLGTAPAMTLEACSSVDYLPLDRYQMVMDCRPDALKEAPVSTLTSRLSLYANGLREAASISG